MFVYILFYFLLCVCVYMPANVQAKRFIPNTSTETNMDICTPNNPNALRAFKYTCIHMCMHT